MKTTETSLIEEENTFKCELVSQSYSPVGQSAKVKANIWDLSGSIKKVVDTVELDIDGGINMDYETMANKVMEAYKASLT